MDILVVEDDPRTGELIRDGLSARGHEPVLIASGSGALSISDRRGFDVAVIDRMLPDIEGVEVLREMRRRGRHFPVLILTALGSIADRVAGLDAGGDDYLIKPFALDELIARLIALHRRAPAPATPSTLDIGEIEIDFAARCVRRRGRYIPLQPREFDVLALLARNIGRPVTRKMFLEQVWHIHYDPSTNVVDSHVSRLRGKLNASAGPDPIETLHGVGYRLRVVP